MGVKLSGTTPDGDRSGLDVLQGALVRHPEQMQVIVAMVDCKTTTLNHGEDSATYTPTARIVYIEAVLDELDREVVEEMIGRIRGERVGEGTVAFDLGLADMRANSEQGAEK